MQITKELLEVQRECFEEETEVVKEQLQEMEVKSITLEKELGFFKAKDQ